MKGYTSAHPLFDETPAQAPAAPAVPLNPTVESWDTQRLTETHKRLLWLLSDHEWHDNGELLHQGGVRYSARLEELTKAGHPWVKEHVSGGTWRYRLLDRGNPRDPELGSWLTGYFL